MAIRQIVKETDELIRKNSKEVTVFDRRLQILVEDMIDTLIKANGVGLAAVQVGILKKLFVIDIDGEFVEFINPELLEESEEYELGQEGCLSCPGKWGDVARPVKVKVSAQNMYGEKFTRDLEGLYARCFMHENNHLSGILFTDLVEGELYE